MGVFSITMEVGDPQGGNFEAVDALVDTGASYSMLPASLLRRLGVASHGQRPFLLADGRRVTREIGQTRIRIEDQTLMTVVVFGDEDTQCLLGAVTLEEFGLGIDPVARKLIPVPGYLMFAEPLS